MAEVGGTCDERFELVRTTFAKSLDAGADVGASVAVYLDGEPVVDIWGGYADEARTQPWERDTITNVWSTTKTMTFLCALVLADRGELEFHAPVARYWPEFAAGGKERVEVRHVMGHTAGLSGWTEPLEPEDLADWEKVTSLLAAQEPWWEPGSASGYHAVTQGFLIGEIVRRITGASIGSFFADEIAGPLGADFHIGLPARGRPASLVRHPAAADRHDRDRSRTASRSAPSPTRASRRRCPRGVVASGGDPRRERSRQRPIGGGRSSRSSPASAKRGVPGCSRPRAATRSSRCSRTGPTSCSACRSVSAWATA